MVVVRLLMLPRRVSVYAMVVRKPYRVNGGVTAFGADLGGSIKYSSVIP
jgi:hypothetical protein